ncbi:MAG: HEAT repeat domain-containing protein [Acidimicrobiales bacterium]
MAVEPPHYDISAALRQVALAAHDGNTEVLSSHLDSGEEVVRAAAVRGLWECTHGDPTDPQAVLLMLHEFVGKERATHVLVAVGETFATRHGKICEVLLDHEDTRVVEAGCFAAAQLAPSANHLVGRLEALASTHEDDLVRESAIAALGAYGLPRSTSIVIAATSDKVYVRRRAIVALSAFEGEDVEEALRAATADRDAQTRALAEDILRAGSLEG